MGIWGVLGWIIVDDCTYRSWYIRDTVGSIGISGGSGLPFATSTFSIKTFRHALALDERRTRFQANLWDSTGSFSGKNSSEDDSEPREASKMGFAADVLEVWFAGSHSGKSLLSPICRL
jgi:hypothetical protein